MKLIVENINSKTIQRPKAYDEPVMLATVPEDITSKINASCEEVVLGLDTTGQVTRKDSIVFELALTILLMRANCCGRNQAFYNLQSELLYGIVDISGSSNGRNEIVADEFVTACGILKSYIQQNTSPSPEQARVRQEASTRNSLFGAIARRNNQVSPGPQTTSVPPGFPRPAWRSGFARSSPPPPAGGGGGGSDTVSGLSTSAAIMLSIAVVAASALVGAIKSAS